jgi:primosomal protein N' (replication factor Y)
MSTSPQIVQVAIAAPLRRLFDYLPIKNGPVAQPGARVKVGFGRRHAIGVVVGGTDKSHIRPDRLKSVSEVLDRDPLIPPSLLNLLLWAANYYHHPIGEVVLASLPVLLRRGRVAHSGMVRWKLTAEGKRQNIEVLSRAPLQRRIAKALSEAPIGLDTAVLLRFSPRWSVAIKQLKAKGWVEAEWIDELPPSQDVLHPAPPLNDAQQSALEDIAAALDSFKVLLLHGVTGSGKTEVYLQVVAQVMSRGQQALVLVPEIALTPQLIQRFQARFHVPVAVLHSGLNESQRLRAWLAARSANARIVLGTRSAVFTPIPRLGAIIVDEEHDVSYKQQDGFRYSARDVAIMRARHAGVPVILGSATPSLESINNVKLKNYQLLKLPNRTAGAQLPKIRILDMRRLAPVNGLSHPLRAAIASRLKMGEQSLLFLNRRGYAPVLMCVACGWLAPCRRCDARMTLHTDVRVSRKGRSSAAAPDILSPAAFVPPCTSSCDAQGRASVPKGRTLRGTARGTDPSLDVAGSRERPLHTDVRVSRKGRSGDQSVQNVHNEYSRHDGRLLRCHHCGAETGMPENCPTCMNNDLRPVGEGTERIELALTKFFPKARIVRIDRDTTRHRGALEEKLKRIHSGEADILVGTQMLSKGHDFPGVTLVGVLNADQGLYNADFRASERLFQQVMQVSGRAGRADKPGEVMIQTFYPDHPLFSALSRHDYGEFAELILTERSESNFPPFTHLALLRAESTRSGAALSFLQTAQALGRTVTDKNEIDIMEPVPAPMERRAGRYRAQLLVQSRKRSVLHAFLSRWLARLCDAKSARSVRWSLDVDPIDMY